jgi:hypothetical protein
MYDIDVLLETGNSVLLVTNLYPELSVFTLTQSLNRNYSAILATLQITLYALGINGFCQDSWHQALTEIKYSPRKSNMEDILCKI